jgi:tRNA (pseudouridine54-N1)-methyltransferase
MTRTFVVLGHDAPTTPEFSLDDLPGAGRLDVLCRAVGSALLTSHAIREDTRVYLVLDREYTLRVEGGAVRRLNPDERSTAALVRTALEAREEAVGRMAVEPSPGLYLARGGLAEVLEECTGPLYQLHEDGEPAVARDLPEAPTFVCSDDQAFRADETELLAEHDARRLGLGPVALHVDQAITVTHHWLDTDGYAESGFRKD